MSFRRIDWHSILTRACWVMGFVIAFLSPAANANTLSSLQGSIANVERVIAEARAQMVNDPDVALAIAKSLHVTVNRMPRQSRVRYAAEIEAVEAQALIRAGRVDAADALIARAERRVSSGIIPDRVQAELLMSQGQSAKNRNNVGVALQSFQESYRLFRRAHEPRWQAIVLQHIALLYVRSGDMASALRYFTQSEEDFSGDSKLTLASKNNKGLAYLDPDPHRAELEFRAALKLAEQLGASGPVTYILANVAQAQVYQQKWDEAESTVDRAFKSVANEKDRVTLPFLYLVRAQVLLHRGQTLAAKGAIDRALSGIDSASTDAFYRQVHSVAYEIYRAVGDEHGALVQLEARARIDADTAQVTASNAAALMAARFDFANQNLKISQLKSAELAKSVAYERTRARLLIVAASASILVALLLVVGLILIARSRNSERAAKLVLAKTNRELERAIAAKMEFLATTSHEIRTPLNGILGMTQVMLADHTLDAALRERVTIVHSAGENMRALVDDILDVAKMESGKLAVTIERVELATILRQVAQVWRLQAESAGVALVLELDDCPLLIEGDTGRLRQIVSNLLSNAMKFTEVGSIALTAIRVKDRVRISVRDSGIGIPSAWHDSIFELFQQVDGGTTRKYGGTGLGLAICRNLARAMGGDIWVESEEGFGSTFTIDLPLVEIQPVARTQKLESAARSGAALVLERNPLTRGLLRAFLVGHFEDLVFVGNDDEMLDAMTHRNFDWIIADADMLSSPNVIDGVTPTILMASDGSDANGVFAKFATVLTKPVSKERLAQIVARPRLVNAAS